MDKLNNIIKQQSWIIIPITLALGLFIGVSWSSDSNDAETTMAHDHGENAVFTCSMHPQIRNEGPGSCPICGMELIPLTEEEESQPDYELTFSNAAMKLSGIEVSRIGYGSDRKEIILPGRIEADERRITEISAHFPGRIEVLNINFTGQYVKKGQELAVIYAPELVTAQKELFEAMKMRDSKPNVYRAARNKFKLWEFTEAQIDQLESSGAVQYNFRILSPISGTVVKRNISKGDHVMEGASMFQVVDLRKVWVLFDAYETELPFIKTGDQVQVEFKAAPGRAFSGTVSFIDPIMDRDRRTSIVRVELANQDGLLKPGMLAKGILKAGSTSNTSNLLIPKSAVLWTGKRSIAYVKVSDEDIDAFEYREIILGKETTDHYVVLEGLKEGEYVASNGVFKIDAAAQLQGHKSMMNQEVANN